MMPQKKAFCPMQIASSTKHQFSCRGIGTRQHDRLIRLRSIAAHQPGPANSCRNQDFWMPVFFKRSNIKFDCVIFPCVIPDCEKTQKSLKTCPMKSTINNLPRTGCPIPLSKLLPSVEIPIIKGFHKCACQDGKR